MENKELKEKLDKINRISLKEIIEDFGGVFINQKQFYHPYLGNEKTPSGFIYLNKENQERWKHFKNDIGGDAVEFVKTVTGASSIFDAVNKILGEDKTYKVKSSEEMAEYNEKLKAIKLAEEAKSKKKIYAIMKNSVSIFDSEKGLEYFQKRGLLEVIAAMRSKNMKILFNSYRNNEGKEINSIVYAFPGNSKKGTQPFIILKGIDKNPDGTRFKMNVMTSRPISFMSDNTKPIIICEGIEDSLSAVSKVFQYKNFISLNSTTGAKKVIDMMDKCPSFFKKHEFHVCLDNDKTGINTSKRLIDEGLKRGINIKESEISIALKSEKVNDLNDLLVKYTKIISESEKKMKREVAASKEMER